MNVRRYGEAGPGPAGSVLTVEFRLEGQDFIALNGGPADFAFNESVSFLFNCETQKEVDELWEKLLEGGPSSSAAGSRTSTGCHGKSFQPSSRS